jgi:hypothetical protein
VIFFWANFQHLATKKSGKFWKFSLLKCKLDPKKTAWFYLKNRQTLETTKLKKKTLEANKWKKFILLRTAIYAYYLIGICNSFFIYLAPK